METQAVCDLSEALISAVSITNNGEAEETVALELVRKLVGDGADVNHIRNDGGWTVLTMSICTRHLKVIKYLLNETEADVNLADRSGDTPLIYALAMRYTEDAHILLQHKDIDVNGRNTSGSGYARPIVAALNEPSMEIIT